MADSIDDSVSGLNVIGTTIHTFLPFEGQRYFWTDVSYRMKPDVGVSGKLLGETGITIIQMMAYLPLVAYLSNI